MSTAVAPAPEINTLADWRAAREKGQVPLDKPVETKPAADDREKTPAEQKPADQKTDDKTEKVTTAAPEEDAGGEESKQQERIDKEARKRERLDRRFAELTSERDEARRLLAEARGGAPKPAEQQPAAAAVPDPKDPEPVLEKYTDYLQWQKDWNRWAIRAEARKLQAESDQRKAADTQRAAAAAWDAKQSKARDSHEDYDEVALDRNLPITNVMGQAITDADNGAELLYWLGENPKEAARIAGLSAIAQVREIGKLELKLSSTPAEEKAPEAKAISNAPRPVKALAGAAAQSTAVKNLEGMSQSDYRKYRETGQIK
jgi:hypothetical protein